MSRRDTTKCPNCGEIIELDSHNEVGDVIPCHNCGMDLEIVNMNPPRVKALRGYGTDEEQEENYEDFDYRDEDDQYEDRFDT